MYLQGKIPGTCQHLRYVTVYIKVKEDMNQEKKTEKSSLQLNFKLN